MNITDIKFIKISTPTGGLSQPTAIFHLICDTGYETDICFNTWYLQSNLIKNEILSTLDNYFTNRIFIDNLNEVVNTIINTLIANKYIPYNKKEI